MLNRQLQNKAVKSSVGWPYKNSSARTRGPLNILYATTKRRLKIDFVASFIDVAVYQRNTRSLINIFSCGSILTLQFIRPRQGFWWTIFLSHITETVDHWSKTKSSVDNMFNKLFSTLQAIRIWRSRSFITFLSQTIAIADHRAVSQFWGTGPVYVILVY